jgi:hypothetical protein
MLIFLFRDVHPSAFISRIYFENQLCSAPITSPHDHTDNGIRVTLGDLGTRLLFLSLNVALLRTFCPTDCQDASDILIYGQLVETYHSYLTSSTSQDITPVLQLRAARIITQPSLQQPRPRPDDPVPRFPPTLMNTKRRRVEESPSTRLKRRKEEAVLQNARNVMTRMPSADVIRNVDGTKMPWQDKTLTDDVFKVPPPPGLKGKGKALDIAKELEKANKAVSRACFLPLSYLF